MSRQYGGVDEVTATAIEVRRAPDDSPEHFLWRDRLYTVCDVLDRWYTSPAWWSDLDEPLQHDDWQVWRVTAAAGRTGTPGVYEVTFQPQRQQWFLTRVMD